MYNLKSPFLRRLRNRVATFYRHTIRRYAVSAYSQEGEDLILARLFESKTTGFYVDVGAHHPHRFSNTYRFYRRGWRGINVDAMPGSMSAFAHFRPRDINLEIGVSRDPTKLTYYVFTESALNTFDQDLAQRRQQDNQLQSQIPLNTRRLDEVLDQYLPQNQSIDFLSVDVEGLDLDVLQSNNWQLYRPTFVLAETLHRKGNLCSPNPIADYMTAQEYELVAHTLNTGIFQDRHAR